MSQAAINIRSREPENVASGRSNGSQLAGLVFLMMVLGTIVWGGWMVVGWMKDAHRLPLSKLVVTGQRYYTTNDDIRQAILALGAPGTFMTQDVNVIQQQIERLPWIKQASVRKQWPDELKIHLVEYVPVARWNDLHMLDASGKSFSVPAERIGNKAMPMLYGPEGSEQDVLTGYRTMSEVMTANKFQLKTVSMSARHSWQLTLQDDIRLELGRDDRARRLQRFIGIYPVLLQQARTDNKRISYVDLRYDAGVAVGWAPAFIDQQQNSISQQNQAQAK
ncbi:cell division protein FtsQ [Acerihabitans arboris]|uniref:Cell division protein FtsQ n=1 Tax=Acerihabitans arboris TaxID=2691583 RepID=A0A845SDX6_9GAMM|nr:cell division protein FtsQ [Acerihabitans arboris]NDL61286.1 cell division protein FtsQ [Acerihabitans arboris]